MSSSALRAAAAAGNIPLLLAADPALLLRLDPGTGETLLHTAVAAGQPEVVALLARRCPDLITARDAQGLTPLEAATFTGDAVNVALLQRPASHSSPASTARKPLQSPQPGSDSDPEETTHTRGGPIPFRYRGRSPEPVPPRGREVRVEATATIDSIAAALQTTAVRLRLLNADRIAAYPADAPLPVGQLLRVPSHPASRPAAEPKAAHGQSPPPGVSRPLFVPRSAPTVTVVMDDTPPASPTSPGRATEGESPQQLLRSVLAMRREREVLAAMLQEPSEGSTPSLSSDGSDVIAVMRAPRLRPSEERAVRRTSMRRCRLHSGPRSTSLADASVEAHRRGVPLLLRIGPGPSPAAPLPPPLARSFAVAPLSWARDPAACEAYVGYAAGVLRLGGPLDTLDVVALPDGRPVFAAARRLGRDRSVSGPDGTPLFLTEDEALGHIADAWARSEAVVRSAAPQALTALSRAHDASFARIRSVAHHALDALERAPSWPGLTAPTAPLCGASWFVAAVAAVMGRHAGTRKRALAAMATVARLRVAHRDVDDAPPALAQWSSLLRYTRGGGLRPEPLVAALRGCPPPDPSAALWLATAWCDVASVAARGGDEPLWAEAVEAAARHFHTAEAEGGKTPLLCQAALALYEVTLDQQWFARAVQSVPDTAAALRLLQRRLERAKEVKPQPGESGEDDTSAAPDAPDVADPSPARDAPEPETPEAAAVRSATELSWAGVPRSDRGLGLGAALRTLQRLALLAPADAASVEREAFEVATTVVNTFGSSSPAELGGAVGPMLLRAVPWLRVVLVGRPRLWGSAEWGHKPQLSPLALAAIGHSNAACVVHRCDTADDVAAAAGAPHLADECRRAMAKAGGGEVAIVLEHHEVLAATKSPSVLADVVMRRATCGLD